MKTNPNESAYPTSPVQNFEESLPAGGLTKREYFAAIVLANIAKGSMPKTAAETAVEYADSLIATLNKASIPK